MTKHWYGTLFGAILALLIGGALTGSAQAAATWQVVRNSDCTAAGAATGVTGGAVSCCTGVGSGFCEQVEAGGSFFTRYVTLATSSSSNTYTAAGDSLVAAQLAKITTPGTFVLARCSPLIGLGYSPALIFTTGTQQRAPKVALASGTGDLTAATAINSAVLECAITGY